MFGIVEFRYKFVASREVQRHAARLEDFCGDWLLDTREGEIFYSSGATRSCLL